MTLLRANYLQPARTGQPVACANDNNRNNASLPRAGD